jgi:hypothetical protein
VELLIPSVKIAAVALLAVVCFWVHRRTLSAVRRRITAFGSLVILLYAAYLAYLHVGYNSDLAGSPDGKYVARIMISPGTLVDSELSSVIVRRSWSPVWRRVWIGEGWLAGGGEANPRLRWVDSSHLSIDYAGSMSPQPVCLAMVDNVSIECRPHTW